MTMRMGGRRRPFQCYLALGCAVVALAGPAWGQSDPNKGVAAYIGDEKITMAEVDAIALEGNMKLAQQVYDARKTALDDIIMKRTLTKEAAKAGVSYDEFLKQRLAQKTQPVTDADIEAFFNARKSQMRGQTLEAMSGRIRTYLQSQRESAAKNLVMADVRAASKVRVLLDAPRAKVVVTPDEPMKGSPSAKVAVVEYSDFQCPYCSRVEGTIKQVEQAYGDKIKLVFRNFPLGMHKRAMPAAIASECAHQQGKFWEYHDTLFSNQKALEDSDLTKYAADLGLDAEKFKACIASSDTKRKVNQTMSEGQKSGVTGTPAFFINGRFLSGAQQFNAFKKVIDEELNG